MNLPYAYEALKPSPLQRLKVALAADECPTRRRRCRPGASAAAGAACLKALAGSGTQTGAGLRSLGSSAQGPLGCPPSLQAARARLRCGSACRWAADAALLALPRVPLAFPSCSS